MHTNLPMHICKQTYLCAYLHKPDYTHMHTNLPMQMCMQTYCTHILYDYAWMPLTPALVHPLPRRLRLTVS